MRRRDFFKTSMRGLAMLGTGGLVELLLSTSCIQKYQPRISDMERALWFYPGKRRDKGFSAAMAVKKLTPEILDYLVHYNINTIYLSGTYSMLIKPEQTHNYQKIRTFIQACNEKNIEVCALGFEDHNLLKHSDYELEERFEKWVKNTKSLFSKYQVDIEPHVANNFFDNQEERTYLLEKFVRICDSFMRVADKHKVEFSPIVSMIKNVDYNALLREIGKKGLNDISCHYLTIMSYTSDADELRAVVRNKLYDVHKPMLLGVSIHPPYFRNKLELMNIPRVMDDLQRRNPFIRGYIIFSNLKLLSQEDTKDMNHSLPSAPASSSPS